MSIRWEDFTHKGSPLRRKIGLDVAERKIRVATWQPNINDVLEENKRAYNHNNFTGKMWRNEDWTRVASIPMWLIEKWRTEEGIDFFRWNEDDKAKILRKLNDPEYLYLRTAPGRI